MNLDRQTLHGEKEDVGRELDVRQADARYLPKTLDPVITMAAVQRYVESERFRSRRVLLWVTGVFTAVLLAVVAVFVTVGSVVLRNNRQTVEIVDDVNKRTAMHAVEMADVSLRVGKVQESHERMRSEVESVETERHAESRVLKRDLERFSQWIEDTQQRDAGQIVELRERLKSLDKATVEREAELAKLREKNAELEELFRLAGQVPTRAAEPSIPSQTVAAASGLTLATVVASVPPAVSAPADAAGEIRVMDLPNGDRYEGEFRNGLFNGRGVYTCRNGDRYEGEFLDDLKHGKGTYTSAGGDKYVGEFANDHRQGQGTLFFANGDRYVGGFDAGSANGKGVMVYENGSRYEGDFSHGQKQGTGMFVYANGDRYEGSFANDERSGQGIYTFKEGASYVGGFKSGRRHGNGRYKYASGEEYVGEFRDGKKDGVGECLYPGGVKVKGQWKDDQFMGAVVE